MENIKEVQALFNKVVAYSQNIETPETDDLFDRWLEAKRDFIELFGGNLIYEYPEKVYFEISDSEKESRVKDFARTVENKYGNFALSDFIFSHAKDFFPNRMSEAYHDKVNINGVLKEINIDKGMKMLRAFKYFEEDANVLDAIQQAASMIIQENKIGGTLCLSVHPLDFLSSSENNHNWRSCHALDGEYRAGNLSYMLDKSTVMCYLRSEHMEKLPDFPDDVLWNSKKWRVLLFFSDHWDMLFAGRQYPFASMTGLDFVKDKFLTTAGFGEFTACSGYPHCKYIKKAPKPEPVHTGIPCPLCGKGDLVERINVRGRNKGAKFYACSEFPKCRATYSGLPTGDKCEVCGGPMIQVGEEVYCGNEKCKTNRERHIRERLEAQAKKEANE